MNSASYFYHFQNPDHQPIVIGQDPFGRQYLAFYGQGELYPTRLCLAAGAQIDEPLISFTRIGDHYIGHNVDCLGKTYGHIRLLDNGDLAYQYDLADRTRAKIKRFAKGGSASVYESESGVITIERNKDGLRVRRTTQGALWQTQEEYAEDGKTLLKWSLKDQKGRLVVVEKADERSRLWLGSAFDEQGQETEKVVWAHKLLVLAHSAKSITAAMLVEGIALEADNDSDLVMPVVIQGKFDGDESTFTYTDERADAAHRNATMKRWLAPGRLEVTDKRGLISFTGNESGEFSLQFPEGSVVVHHANGDMVLMQSDDLRIWQAGKILAGDNLMQALTVEEIQFRHDFLGQIDLRNFAEIHRLHGANKIELALFYRNLRRLMNLLQLPAEKKPPLLRALMHHVANPAEVYQGSMGSCNVTAVQRQLAMLQPARYVEIILQALSDGFIALKSGPSMPLPLEELINPEASARDIAGRIFQNAALKIELAFADKIWRPSLDGKSRIYEKASPEKEERFHGLAPGQVAQILTELSGQDYEEVLFTSPQAIYERFIANGAKPFILSVDAAMPPIKSKVDGLFRRGHVITIVDIVQGADGSYKAAYMNQWGLAKDASTPARLVDFQALFKSSCTRTNKQNGYRELVDTARCVMAVLKQS